MSAPPRDDGVRHGIGYTIDAARPLIADVLAAHGLTFDDWVPRIRDKDTASLAARGDAIRALRDEHKWSAYRIGVALGLDNATVRRATKGRAATKPAHVAPKRKLHVIRDTRSDGEPAMLAAPGDRLDCVYEMTCLGRLLKQFPAHDPPRFASCPVGCRGQRAPTRGSALYDATRRDLWGV